MTRNISQDNDYNFSSIVRMNDRRNSLQPMINKKKVVQSNEKIPIKSLFSGKRNSLNFNQRNQISNQKELNNDMGRICFDEYFSFLDSYQRFIRLISRCKVLLI